MLQGKIRNWIWRAVQLELPQNLGAQRESAMTDRYMVESITANVNFNIPGIYTVNLVCYGEELQFPVQVIDEEFLTTYGYSAK